MSEPDHAILTIRTWLQSERLLGMEHYALPRIGCDARATAADGRASAKPAARPAPPPPPPAAGQPKPPVRTQPRPAAAVSIPALFSDDPDLPEFCGRELPVDDAAAALAELDAAFVKECVRCRLHEARTQTVFGTGHARPQLVFVGEGPGADEDARGLPFVGRAGQLLTRMIAAMTLTRDQVYICNIVKCRPPGNRTPTDDEMQACGPYVLRQLAILRPRVIVALGRPATQTLLGTKAAISGLRGSFHDFPPPALAHPNLPRARLMPTFHPAYLLRNPAAKADAWDDLKQVMRELGLHVPRKA